MFLFVAMETIVTMIRDVESQIDTFLVKCKRICGKIEVKISRKSCRYKNIHQIARSTLKNKNFEKKT